MNTHPLTIAIVTMLVIPHFRCIGYSESPLVKIRFEIDGRLKTAPKEIEFYAGDGRLIAREHIKDGEFKAPVFEPSMRIDVHLRFAGCNMVFRDILAIKIQGRLVIGIDRRPFDEENLFPLVDLSKQKELWFIEFNPLDAEATRMVVVAR